MNKALRLTIIAARYKMKPYQSLTSYPPANIQLDFAPGDVGELAERLEQGLRDRGFRKEKERLAKEIVEGRFNGQVALPRIEELYSEVLRE